MNVLAFSDLHRNLNQSRRLVEMSADADVVIGAGDFATQHHGLREIIDVLAKIEVPSLLVPGNNETEDALREATSAWESATVLHGDGTQINGVSFFGLGAGIPITPWDWSYDLDESEANQMLVDAPEGGILIVHSPPYGHADQSSTGDHLGSTAILAAIEEKSPRLVVCGHVHESWGKESQIGEARVVNLGPSGTWFELSGVPNPHR